jgi:Fe-S cluster biogenesis protein NfuA
MSRSAEIRIEPTPNPNTLKYAFSAPARVPYPASFTSPGQAAARSPLARDLLSLDGVTSVLVTADFVSVSVAEPRLLLELHEEVLRILEEHLDSDQPLVLGEESRVPSDEESEAESTIRRILDDEIRPAVAMDGGDVTFERFEDGVLYLSMRGACGSCPSSVLTLRMGVEQRLMRDIPELREVVAL